MSSGAPVDGVLVQWGERLFYPSNRIVKPAPTPRLDTMTRRKAAVIRRRIEATVMGRAPQVMVKVTGGGRGMATIAAHFRYISKNGRLDIEDDRGVVREHAFAFDDMRGGPQERPLAAGQGMTYLDQSIGLVFTFVVDRAYVRAHHQCRESGFVRLGRAPHPGDHRRLDRAEQGAHSTAFLWHGEPPASIRLVQ